MTDPDYSIPLLLQDPRIVGGPQQPTVRELIAAHKMQDRRVSPDVHRDRFEAVITGQAKDFWHDFAPGHYATCYDVEQEIALFLAVGRAARVVGASDAQRWQVVQQALRDLAMQYASHDPVVDGWIREEPEEPAKPIKRYVVTMQSVPGMYEQYGPGEISVYATDDDDAIERAFFELKRGAFPDRSRAMWKVLGVRRETT